MVNYIKKIYEDEDTRTVNVIIPCAGIGRRMKSYGCKALIEIGGMSIVQRQIYLINKAIKNPNIILVGGFESDKLMDKTPDDIIKVENEKYFDTNVTRSIGIGLRAVVNKNNALIIFGDVVCNLEALKSLSFQKSCMIISSHMTENEVGCNINPVDNTLEHMMYDLPNKWGHIIYLTGKELRLFQKAIWNRKNDRKFCFEIINEIVNAGGKIRCIQNNKIKALDVDNAKDIKLAQELIQ